MIHHASILTDLERDGEDIEIEATAEVYIGSNYGPYAEETTVSRLHIAPVVRPSPTAWEINRIIDRLVDRAKEAAL